MIGVGLKKTGSHTRTKATPKLLLPPHMLILQNRFGMLVFKKNDRSHNVQSHEHFHSYRQEKLITRAFAARINGIQTTILATHGIYVLSRKLRLRKYNWTAHSLPAYVALKSPFEPAHKLLVLIALLSAEAQASLRRLVRAFAARI